MSLLTRSVRYSAHTSYFVSVDKFGNEPIIQDPILIEGADVYDIICPVSEFSGNRANPLDLLKLALPDKDYRFLNSVLQEIPSIPSDPNLSDDDRVSMLTYRLSSGTPAEDEALMHSLLKVADVLFPNNGSDSVISDKIEFNPDDVSPQSD